jgi:diguanylate cyclase (GGDEF)-like protein
MYKAIVDITKIPLLIISENGLLCEANNAFLNIFNASKDILKDAHYNTVDFLKPLEKPISSVLSTEKSYKQRHNLGSSYFDVTIESFVFQKRRFAFMHFYDITPFLILEKDLTKRNRELMIINTLSGAFISSENIEEVFNDLLEKILLITDFAAGYIVIKTDSSYELKSHLGLSPDFQRELSEGKLIDLFLRIEPMTDPIYIFEGEEIKNIPMLNKEGISFVAAVPIRISNIFKGITFLASRTARTFDFDLASVLSLMSSQLSLIVEKIELFEETRRLAITDTLTGLFNSRYFYQELEKEIARSHRYKNTFSLAILDLDDFKVINDTYGHQTGDEILIAIASALRAESRGTDIVARYGGEEFVIIFPNTSKKEAVAVSERILHLINSRTIRTRGGNDVRVTISGGIASLPEDASSSKDLLYAADMAMYEAKGSGKKQIVCYNKHHEKDIRET